MNGNPQGANVQGANAGVPVNPALPQVVQAYLSKMKPSLRRLIQELENIRAKPTDIDYGKWNQTHGSLLNVLFEGEALIIQAARKKLESEAAFQQKVVQKVGDANNYVGILKECYVVLGINKDNRLQPNIYDINALKARGNLLNKIKKCTRLEWLKNVSVLDLYWKINRGLESKLRDLKRRAEELVNHVLTNGIEELVIMDGHGRFLFMFLLILFGRDQVKFNSLKVTVVDIFEDSQGRDVITQFHKLAYPQDIKSIQKDMFTFKTTKKRMLYFNFCGIGGEEGVKMFIKYLNDIGPRTKTPVMISYSVERKGYLSKEAFERLLQGVASEQARKAPFLQTIMAKNDPDARKSFLTYSFRRN